MEITPAASGDLPRLTDLWEASFGDSRALIGAFMDRLFSQIRIYTAREGRDIRAMVCALPLPLVDEEGSTLPCVYFYALCTRPDCRRQGIATALLARAEREEAARGAQYAVLLPADGEKYSFYARQGYEACLSHRRYTVKPGGQARICPAEAETYASLRQIHLMGGFFAPELPFLRCAGSVSGKLWRIETREDLCCAAAEQEGDRLIIRELLPDVPEAAEALCAHLGASEAEVRVPGEGTPFGMMKALKNVPLPRGIYPGLFLD